MASCKDCICSEVCYYKSFNDVRNLEKRRNDVEKICKSFVHRDRLKNAPTVDAVEVVHGGGNKQDSLKHPCISVLNATSQNISSTDTAPTAVQRWTEKGEPMLTNDNPNIMELCFHNGEQHMKEKIIEMLMDQKTKVKGVCHAHVVEIIRMVEGL